MEVAAPFGALPRADVVDSVEHQEWTNMSTAPRDVILDYGKTSLSRMLAGDDPQLQAEAREAMHRMKEGRYGYCVACGMQMPARDIELRPERRYCARCQKRGE